MIKYIFTLLFLVIIFFCFAQEKELKWNSISEVEILQKENPKNIIVDIYADWCYWCKRLDQELQSDSLLVEYISEHFYLVKFNPEDNVDIVFQGKTYSRSSFNYTNSSKSRKVNKLAVEWLGVDFIYPSLIIFDEEFKKLTSVNGFKKVDELSKLFHYFGSDIYKEMKWADYSK